MPTDVDIAVVGAGAAGLASAIFGAEVCPDLKIVLLDGASKIGAKILVSGGGRCNVTHARVVASDYHAPGRVVDRVLRRFNEQATVKWFDSLGVPLKQEPTGKLFPVSNHARTVLGALLHRCDELGLRILTEYRVQDITPIDRGFRIAHQTGYLIARRVVMATGGRSLPKTGSDGQGWSIAQRLGHTVTSTSRALVPLVLEDGFFHPGLSGISHPAVLTTRVGGKVIDRRAGDLLWTHFGISGPVVMDASRFWVVAKEQGFGPELRVSFLPGQGFEDVERWLSPKDGPTRRKTVAATLSQRMPHRLAKALCDYVERLHREETRPAEGESGGKSGGKSGGGGSQAPDELAATALSQLTRPRRRALTHALTDLPLPVVKPRGWNEAEVTAGGIPLKEIDPHTMASGKVPGLYLVGEMLDCDGRIGGFNFQWAWATGFIAGRSAAGGLTETSPG